MGNESPRILHVLPSVSLNAGGPPVAVIGLARALQNLDTKVSVYSTTALSNGVRDVETSSLPGGASELDLRIFPTSGPARIAFSRQLANELENTGAEYDVIHIHSLFQFPQYAAYAAARKSGTPWIVSPHGALDPHLRSRGKFRKRLVETLWQRQMFDRARAIHFTSEDEAALTMDLDYSAPSVVIPNGIDVAGLQAAPELSLMSTLKEELELHEGPIIVNHGRLNHKKGLPILIDAMNHILRRYPTAQLLLIGPDSLGLESHLRRQVGGANLDASVVFSGLRVGRELDALLALADVWALPSYSENFGLAVVEAMAKGLPTVTTRFVNVARDAEAENALVVSDQTAESFASAIVSILDSPARLELLSENGRRFVRRFDWPQVGSRYLDLYVAVQTDA